MAATICTGVVVFVPDNHEGRFGRSPCGGISDLIHRLLQELVPELDDAVIQAGRRGSTGRQIQELRVRGGDAVHIMALVRADPDEIRHLPRVKVAGKLSKRHHLFQATSPVLVLTSLTYITWLFSCSE